MISNHHLSQKSQMKRTPSMFPKIIFPQSQKTRSIIQQANRKPLSTFKASHLIQLHYSSCILTRYQRAASTHAIESSPREIRRALVSSDPNRAPGAGVKPPAADQRLSGAFRVPWGPVRRRGGSGRGSAAAAGRGAAAGDHTQAGRWWLCPGSWGG